MTVLTTTTPMTGAHEEALDFAGDDARPVARKWLWFWAAAVTLMYALVWSPHWYPLSDSSLYLSIGRSFALGRGLTMMGDPVRLVPPLTPILLGLLIRAGAGIGTIQAVMIALMLVAHAICFLTLRRWTNERLALGATLATALSYWVFANAFTIMSEPLCVLLMWTGFLALSHVSMRSRYRWPLVIAGCVLMIGAAANRDAILCLLPGPVVALLMRVRRPDGSLPREAKAWAVIFVVAFGAWTIYRYPPAFLTRLLAAKTKLVVATQPTTAPVQAINPEFDGDVGPREGRYRAHWMDGVPRDYHMMTEPPVLGGRWVCEGMVMAAVRVFEAKEQGLRAVGTTVALIALGLTIAGGLVLWQRQCWWVIGPALYFTLIWLQWGTRIKPRYMVPIAPLLILCLWCGITWLIVHAARLLKRRPWDGPTTGSAVMAVLVGVVVLGNLYPWAVEFYVRHVAAGDFYDVTRRAAYAQLVDIGAYAQKLPADQTLWMNLGAHRRIAYFLSGHKIDVSELDITDWKDWDALVAETRANPTTAPAPLSVRIRRHLSIPQRRKRFFTGLARDAKYLIVCVDHPRKQDEWPGWHLPFRKDDVEAEWWRLYERQPDGTWKKMSVPRSRDYVRSIPGAAT